MRARKGWSAATVTLVLAAGAAVPGTAAAASRAQLDALAQKVDRVESVRDIKVTQRSYAQLAQSGQFNKMAQLFAANGTLRWGDEVVTGRKAIRTWLTEDAGAMDGVRPGSLNFTVIDNPIISLSPDGRTAKGRWDSIRFMGDGQGNTRIDGGIYENRYVLEDGAWKIAELHYHRQFEGDYANGWRNADGAQLPVVPYHFTPDSVGVPIPAPSVPAPRTNQRAEDLAGRIQELNDEDDVRNLQHSYGYYVDRRMWSDVVDLFGRNPSVTIAGVGSFHGADGVRQAMEQTMGPEGLVQSTLNEHLTWELTVDVKPNGKRAVAHGLQLGMLEEPTTRKAEWTFSVVRNTFVKEDGLWKLKELDITPLIRADYADGWGDGGTAPPAGSAPNPLKVVRNAGPAAGQDLATLERRLARSAAYDATENLANSYSTYINDLNFRLIGDTVAEHGFKESPFIGFYKGGDRIAEVGGRYGPPPTIRNSIAIHWNPQPVILVSHDGRSSQVHARLLQLGTSRTSASSFAGGLYTNQYVLEDGIWRAWDITIDEFYWRSANWATGWAGVEPRDPDAPPPPPNPSIEQWPPDLLLSDMNEREVGFQGGVLPYIAWPDIVPYWFNYRNLVSGRVPQYYQPDCTPCGVKPSWSMVHYGYQAPPNGPNIDGIGVYP